ncbi:hypothetical protein A11S_232 [Micavibrio aeruginosavorus EPB]|uniref:Uncharacterized protein n=1 Tax=Micavibrio aeruginosavorus EPB TaxID=349215 RepID=M4VCY3_9BACT|nr:hypothetical protein A11S_232 [Micavibrio aeruginosavorus EPB]
MCHAPSPTQNPTQRERVLSSWLVGIGRQIRSQMPQNATDTYDPKSLTLH